MNDRDPSYVAALQRYYARYRGFPSYEKLLSVMGLSSRSAVKKVLERLRTAGFITRNSDDVWVPDKRFFERALAESTVHAGLPSEVADIAAQPFYVDEYLVGSPDSTVVIRVQGDSMVDAHIDDGDLVILDRNKRAAAGDFVVARVDGEFTLKELVLRRGRWALKPHNPAYPLVVPKGELDITGVVVGLIRKYVRQ